MARESFEDARIAELLNRYFVSIKVDREERPDVDSIYDPVHGGFDLAPKFPTPHIILFLLACYERRGDAECLKMARHSLEQMYRGGLYDHIGFGFCRYHAVILHSVLLFLLYAAILSMSPCWIA